MNLDDILTRANGVLLESRSKSAMKKDLSVRVDKLEKECADKDKLLGDLSRAATLIGVVSDKNTEKKLAFITGVINKALALLFPDGSRKIAIEKTMYREVYPHINVTLITENGERTFKQSGTGLAQVISFLFTTCLIEARGGRKIFIMDELLNGLHPDAKALIKELMLAMSKNFQFIVVEYGMNIGKQYEVVKSGGTSTVTELYEPYYK